jgi:hypothetical protein
MLIFSVLWFMTAEHLLAQENKPTVFIHANLIPMTSETVLANQTVVVQGKHITAVGSSNQTAVPHNAKVIDCNHAYLLPGLADMHMHLQNNWMSAAWPVSPLKLYLANGVTTIRCFGPMGKSGQYALDWRKEIDSGRLDGPRILTCGPQLRGHFKTNPEHLVIRQKYQRFDFVKIYSYVTRNEYHTIVSTAKSLDFYTAGHIPFQVGLDGVLAEGMDEIAHIEELLWEFSEFDRGRYFESEGEWMSYVIHNTFQKFEPCLALTPQERDRKLDAMMAPVVSKFKGLTIPVCTTLVVDDVIVQKLFELDLFLQRPEIQYMPRGYRELLQAGNEKHQRQFKGGEVFAPFKYALDKKLLTGLKSMGQPLLLSTDAGTGGMGIVPGFSLHDELEILVENGFTPYEAIAAGTSVASKVVGRMSGQDDFGTILPGKRADLLLLEQNPLENVTNTRKISGVMAAGRWYDQKALAAMISP